MVRSNLAAVGTLLAGVALAGCGGAAADPTRSPSELASAATTTRPAAPTSAPPSVVAPQPSRLPGGTLVGTVPDSAGTLVDRLRMADGVLQVETDTAVIVLDPATASVQESVPLPDVPQINAWLFSEDSLWVTDHNNGAVVRMDRESGEQIARIQLPRGRVATLLATDEGIWAGGAHEMPEFVARIDPATNQIAQIIEQGAYPVSDGQNLWFGRTQLRTSSTAREVDPNSGEVLTEMDLDGAEGCYLGGAFAEVVWSWCLEPPPDDTVAARLDIEGGQVVAEVALGGTGELAAVVGQHTWFWAITAEDSDWLLLRIDNEQNAIDKAYQLPATTLFTFDHTALWVLDRESRELTKYPLAEM